MKGSYSVYVKEALTRCFETIKKMDEATIRRRVSLNRFGDQTFEIDRVAEDVIFETTKEYFEDAIIVSEESEIMKLGKGMSPVIVVDPIDGSVNASRGYPCYSSSIAIAKGKNLGDVVCSGVINLLNGNLYFAENNEGAFLNGSRIKVSKVEEIEEALIAVDLNVRGRLPGYVNNMSDIIEKAKHFRFLGTNALELCLVASGAADAFVDLRGFLRSLDFAAASLIIKEAGGVILDGVAKELDVRLIPVSRSSLIAASSRRLAKEIIQRLKKHR